jgi:alpha-2-macroglobulin
MPRLLYVLVLFLPVCAHSQPVNNNIRTKSYQTFVYKVSTTTAEKFVRNNDIDLNSFLDQPPFATLEKDNEHKTALPSGNYVFISVDHNSIKASFESISSLYVYTVNNRKRLQLLIIDKYGKFTENAKVWVSNKQAPYSIRSKSYRVRQKKLDDAIVKVYTATDTLFSGISSDDEPDYTVRQQRWRNLRYSKFLKIVKWPWRAVKRLANNKLSFSDGASGMILFNQPKYKKTDTVKLKAYLYIREHKVFTKAVDVFLEYYNRNKFQSTLIRKIRPTSPGSYQLDFALSDTLTANSSYTIQFKRSGKNLLRSTFSVEDYLLDDITEYNFRSDKEIYYPGDTMHFYASAKDANGLSVLDAKTRLVLKVNNILKFYRDSVYVPDTLFVQQKKLEAEGDTRFVLPTDILKDVSADILANLQFINSNNEIQEKEANISLLSVNNELTSSINSDTITVTYRENGNVVSADGIMVKADEWSDTINIRYPHQEKIDPMAYGYSFYRIQNGKTTDSVEAKLKRYEISLDQINSGDTLGFNLNNPFAIPVTYSVFYGNKIIGSGRSSDETIKWRLTPVNKNRIYRVAWQYRWAGEEEAREDRIAVYYKLLNIDVKSNSTVFPGQKDTITINAKNYKNKPAEKINLTAFAYNNQFGRDIKVPEPPYLMRFAVRQSVNRNTYEEDYADINSSFALGEHPAWRKKFGTDSMLYYKMIFPENGFTDMPTPIWDYLPQLSVHVVKNGEWQPACMVYINRELVYYSDVTTKMKNVYSTVRGYTHIGIRLTDRLVEIDSIYLQPYYKHDLFLDIDRLPANAKVAQMPSYLTNNEKYLLEKSMLQIDKSRDAGGAYIWQHDRVVNIGGNTSEVVGPFREGDSLHYFEPGGFDMHFVFEPGYEYRLTNKIARLEKKRLFTDQKYELKPTATQWSFGDTIIKHPEISYEEAYVEPSLNLSPTLDSKDPGGKLLFTLHKDSAIKYVVVYPVEDPNKKLVFDGNKRVIQNLTPGDYTLLLIDRHWRTLEIPHIRIIENKTLCLHTEHIAFKSGNSLLWRWWNERDEAAKNEIDSSRHAPASSVETKYPKIPSGNATIAGTVSDADGKLAIIGAIVFIKRTGTGTSTDASGRFNLANIKAGTYVVTISFVGYDTKEITVTVKENNTAIISVQLKASQNRLEEVVVMGYGFTRRSSLTYSTVSQQNAPLTALAGKVAGIEVQKYSPLQIRIRGAGTVVDRRQLYIIDGVLYDEIPANISNNMIATISVLEEAAAVALYGSRAANGAVVITTNNSNVTRKQFRDYAFWKPELFTDKNGEAKFVVEYPENITGWQLFVLGMDKQRRIGKTVRFIKSYKPVWAELNLPRFLIESDSAEIVGTSVNYSEYTYSLKSMFTVNGRASGEQEFSISRNESVIRKYNISTNSHDTLKASFYINSTTGFKDGEELVIPVFKKGTLQDEGQFWMLTGDTTVHFTAPVENEPISIYAQNNTLDLLLNEIEALKKYPYACNEQTASKLRGLVIEKEIRKELKQKFNEEKTIGMLLRKLLNGQQYDGGWSWWEGGKSNIHITNYVLNALLELRAEANVEMHIRNGLLYLQNRLAYLKRDELLPTLVTMSRAGHVMDYSALMKKIEFDSLRVHEQWQWILVSQFMKTKYERELKKLIEKRTKGMLGGVYWGEENYRWYGNDVATTVLAFDVLQKEENMEGMLDGIVQYFLATRRSGHWRNTVESASIVSVVLPYVLKEHGNFHQAAVIQVTGDTSFTVTKFPFEMHIENVAIKNLNIQKSGGGLTYLTLFQHRWTSDPQPVTEDFKVDSRFEKDGRSINDLASGEKVTMVVDIKTEKEAEYVMIEIPIPAGCVYGKNETSSGGLHRELLKDKVVLFNEALPKGDHRFTIELEARYNGRFTLNPAKASLMYYPTFYGRNGVKGVKVQ